MPREPRKGRPRGTGPAPGSGKPPGQTAELRTSRGPAHGSRAGLCRQTARSSGSGEQPQLWRLQQVLPLPKPPPQHGRPRPQPRLGDVAVQGRDGKATGSGAQRRGQRAKVPLPSQRCRLLHHQAAGTAGTPSPWCLWALRWVLNTPHGSFQSASIHHVPASPSPNPSGLSRPQTRQLCPQPSPPRSTLPLKHSQRRLLCPVCGAHAWGWR